MSNSEEPHFDAADQAILDDIGKQLRVQGWADFITVAYMLRQWRELAAEVEGYAATIYDYTNDLCARDGLEIALGQCPEPLRRKLMRLIEPADREFLNRTQADTNGIVGRSMRIQPSAGWWWHRIPLASPNSDFIDGRPRDRS